MLEKILNNIIKYYEEKEEYEKCKTILDFLNKKYSHKYNYYKIYEEIIMEKMNKFMPKTTKELIEEILSSKMSCDKKNELEIILVNTNLSMDEKEKIIKFINDLITK